MLVFDNCKCTNLKTEHFATVNMLTFQNLKNSTSFNIIQCLISILQTTTRNSSMFRNVKINRFKLSTNPNVKNQKANNSQLSTFKHIKTSKIQNYKMCKFRASGGAPAGVRLARTRKATPYTLRWTQHYTTKVTVTLLIVMKASFFLSHVELFSYYLIYAPLRTPNMSKISHVFRPPFPL